MFAVIGSNETVYLCDIEAIRKKHQNLGSLVLDIDDDSVAVAIADSEPVGSSCAPNKITSVGSICRNICRARSLSLSPDSRLVAAHPH